jgi:FkbM family methyltransferase
MLTARQYHPLYGGTLNSADRTFMDRLVGLAQYVSMFGANGVRIFFQSRFRLKTREVALRVPGILGTAFVRQGTSDLCVFDQMFVEQQYRCPFLIDPKFIVDAGANVGFATAYFAAQYPHAKIVAVEPEAANFAQLQKNVGSLKNVTCIQAALWPTATRLRIQDPGVQSHSFQIEPADQEQGNDPPIKAITVGEIIQGHNMDMIDLLKIDIEGAEKEVFSHSADWIDRVRVIMVELHDGSKPGCSKAFWNAIRNRNFSQCQNGEVTIVSLDSAQ